MNNPSVAIVILNWNTSHFLKKFLPPVLATTYPNKEVYVIDNYSSDDSVVMLQGNFPSVHIIRMHSNKGYASGYNYGLSQIKAEYYLLVNSDIEVTPDFIEPLVNLMENDLSIAACQPKLLSLDERQMFEYAGAGGGWIDIMGYPFAKGRVLLTIEEDKNQYQDAEPIFWASGACMLLRASVYKEIGGFYDYYYMHQEDIDLCWRAQNSGYKIYSCPQSVVYHIGGGSLSWENHLKTFLTFRNNYILLTRNLSYLYLLPVISFRLFIDLIGCIYFLFKKKAGISRAMFKSGWAYFYWLLFYPNKKNKQARGFGSAKGVYRGVILYPYFFKNKRKFSQIIQKTSSI